MKTGKDKILILIICVVFLFLGGCGGTQKDNQEADPEYATVSFQLDWEGEPDNSQEIKSLAKK